VEYEPLLEPLLSVALSAAYLFTFLSATRIDDQLQLESRRELPLEAIIRRSLIADAFRHRYRCINISSKIRKSYRKKKGINCCIRS